MQSRFQFYSSNENFHLPVHDDTAGAAVEAAVSALRAADWTG